MTHRHQRNLHRVKPILLRRLGSGISESEMARMGKAAKAILPETSNNGDMLRNLGTAIVAQETLRKLRHERGREGLEN